MESVPAAARRKPARIRVVVLFSGWACYRRRAGPADSGPAQYRWSRWSPARRARQRGPGPGPGGRAECFRNKLKADSDGGGNSTRT